MNNLVSFIVGIPALGIALWMLSPSVSTRIRRSRYWFLGWLAYLFLLSLGTRLMIPLWDQAGINDDVAVPVLLGTVMVVVLTMYLWRIWTFRRAIRRTTHGLPYLASSNKR